jgi:hypothetical protein
MRKQPVKTLSRKTRSPGGRPRKFSEPSQPVTVTLPLSTIEQLSSIDHDRAKAIVRATRHATGNGGKEDVTVDVLITSPGHGLIVVGNSRYLQEVDCIRLVRVDDHRNLISVATGTPVAMVEITLRDLLETIPSSEVRERTIIRDVAELLRKTRQSGNMKKEEIMIVPI